MERNKVRQRYGQAVKANALFIRHRELRRELEMVPAWSVAASWHTERRRELARLNQTLANLGVTN